MKNSAEKKCCVMVVAKTESTANYWCGELKRCDMDCKATWLGATKPSNRFQAAVIVGDGANGFKNA